MTGDQASPTVTDLRLVAVTPDRSHLVLEDADSRQFRVPVDARHAAAPRPDPTRGDRSRPGQLEIALQSQLTPREIQARVRAGQSVDEVSHAAGMAVDRVERYAGPVIAERQHVVEQAQRAPARRASAGKAPALLDLVDARLAEQRASRDTVEWDAWRGDDDRWTVRLSYLADGRARLATWVFDPRGRVLAPADDEARWLVDGSGADREVDAQPAAIRRLAAVPVAPGDEDPVGPSGCREDEVYVRDADVGGKSPDSPAEPQEPHESIPARQVAAARSGRRPAVPSWDDIMFGTRKRP
jgi:hypothetical protein